jgi:hypothetical protein
MKDSKINYGNAGETGNSTDHFREYYSGIAIVKSDGKMILPRISQAWSKLRKKIKHGFESLKNKLMGPVKPLKDVIFRKSNLLHDYYAVNSIDGMILIAPIPSSRGIQSIN